MAVNISAVSLRRKLITGEFLELIFNQNFDKSTQLQDILLNQFRNQQQQPDTYLKSERHFNKAKICICTLIRK